MVRTRFTTDELKVWETKLPGVEIATAAPPMHQENPLVFGSRLFVSTFKSASTFALARRTGNILWRADYSLYGDSLVSIGSSIITTNTCSVICLSRGSGKIRWMFTPSGEDGEHIYSFPKFDGGRLFIGDRGGNVHCLKVSSGELIWTSKIADNDVNSSCAVDKRAVFFGTNDATVVALSKLTGAILWRSEIDGNCVSELVTLGPSVCAVTAEGVILLNRLSGEITRRVKTGPGLKSAFARDLKGLTFLSNQISTGKPKARRGTQLITISKSGSKRRQLSDLILPQIQIAKGKLYISHFGGVEIRNQKTGRLIAKITDVRSYFCDIPSIGNGVIYLLRQGGSVVALHDPTHKLSTTKGKSESK